ncbi:hypothetical protein [Marinitenerispora sediminis]|nr:hypothetical protein [Marinitenerispora sediminis]
MDTHEQEEPLRNDQLAAEIRHLIKEHGPRAVAEETARQTTEEKP